MPRLLRVLLREGRGVAVVLVALAAIGAGRGVRYAFVEPEAMAARCEVTHPWWCGLRTALIVCTQWNGIGWLALALTAVGAVQLLRGRTGTLPLWSAVIAAGFAMVLYNATAGSIAAVCAGLLLLRAGERPPEPMRDAPGLGQDGAAAGRGQ